MTKEIFVDGICEIEDTAIKSYFGKFGSRITAYAAFRHRPENSCCFARITFDSHHTVNAVLRHRPHIINSYPIFVKRLLPGKNSSFKERILPVTSLFAYGRTGKGLDQRTLKTYCETFGRLAKFTYNKQHDCLLIGFDDYDAVDQFLLSKSRLLFPLSLQKNITPHTQSKTEYRGTCRAKASSKTTNGPDKKLPEVKTSDVVWQDLLQTAVNNLTECKIELKTKENDYRVLQLQCTSLEARTVQLTALLDEKNARLTSCSSCKEREVTIARLQQTLTSVNEQYDIIKSQYQRLLPTQSKPPVPIKFTTRLIQRPPQLPLTKCNSVQQGKQQVSNHDDSTAVSCNTVLQATTNRPQFRRQQVTYKYQPVKNDLA